MKRLKTLLAFLLIAALLAAQGLAAFAEEGAAEPAPTEEGAAEPVPDWDEIVQALLDEHNAYSTQVAAGYLNLVTGEEHYLNPDTYMAAASMFKLPLCMYFTELQQNGEVVWDEAAEHVSYKQLQDNILLFSSNEDAQVLWEKLGGFERFRKLTAHYMGASPDEMVGSVTTYNLYTPRQFIACLKLLYTESERFPGVLETMKQAMPDRYFCLNENRYDVAHKFGYVPSTTDGEDNLMNDCGIVYTSQPFALVLFTSNVAQGEQLLTAYCTAMCDYTETMAALAPPEAPAAEPVPETAAETAALPGLAPSEESAPEAAVMPSFLSRLSAGLSSVLPAQMQELPLVPLGFVLLFVLLGIIAILRFCFRYKARFFTLLFSLLISAAAMLLAVAGLYNGTVYARPSGDPAQTVTLFFDDLCAGKYEEACEYLRDYADLGLGGTPSTAAGRQVSDALYASYAYELVGEPEINMLDAVQKLRFRYLRLPSIEEDVAAETQRQIEAIVETRSASEIYDEDRHYLPAVTQEAYLAALDAVLAHAEQYYTEDELSLSLTYTDGRWQLLMSQELLRALGGGTGV